MTRSNEDRPELNSWSQFRRYVTEGGDDWWINHEAPPNGIASVCLFCDRLCDWPPRDHALDCPVRRYMRWDPEEEYTNGIENWIEEQEND